MLFTSLPDAALWSKHNLHFVNIGNIWFSLEIVHFAHILVPGYAHAAKKFEVLY